MEYNNENFKLLLSFDVNKTIMMSDKAGEKSVENCINIILSSKCYGTVENNQWIWDNLPPTTVQPQDIQKICYYDFLKIQFQDKLGEDLKQLKLSRDQLMNKFTESNQPGHDLRQFYDQILEKLQLPQQYRQGKQSEISGLLNRKTYQIVPALFECLLQLKRLQIDFNINFRTFGQDIDAIFKEFNSFCDGQHPIYQTNLFKEYSLKQNNIGCFYRCLQGNFLILETVQQPLNFQDFQDNFIGKFQIIQGIKDIYIYLKEKKSFFVRDYYQFWRENLEKGQFGKIFPIDLKDTNTLPIIFDDNIGRKNPKIVDARNIIDEQIIQFSECKDIYLVRVEPIEIILQPQNYFTNLILKSIKTKQSII